MRAAFAGQLVDLEQGIDDELTVAIGTLEAVAGAVADPTRSATAKIADSARRLHRHSHGVDAALVTIVARQAPVASDLRLVLALIQLAHHEGLIANQFELIGEQLTEIDTGVMDREGTTHKLSSMARLAGSQLRLATAVFASRDLTQARQVDQHDDAIDKLNREIFEACLDADAHATPQQRALGLRHVLISRSLERVGDNAVDIAEQAAFLATAELREFSDASRPKPSR